jgi:hypothetical protein
MSTRKKKINKTDPFTDDIIFVNNVNYSQVKDFPIFWSGFFTQDNERDDYDGVYNKRGDLLKSLMIKASRIVKGFTTMDVRIKEKYITNFDEEQDYEDEDELTAGLLDKKNSSIRNTELQQYTQRIPTARSSQIYTQRTPTQRTPTQRTLTQRTATARFSQPYTQRMPTQRTLTQRTPTQRTLTQRTATARSSQPYTQRFSERSKRQFFSPKQKTLGDILKELESKNLSVTELIKAKRDVIFSKKFTVLALQSDPKNIGLFVNCSPNEFVDKIFYNLEFDIIVKHYKRRQMPVTLHIFNIKNDNCVNLQKNIMLTYNKLNKEQLTKAQLTAELTESIKHINCYDLLELVQTAKKKLLGIFNGLNDPNQQTFNNDTSRSEDFNKLISEIIKSITEILEDETCNIKYNKKFIELKNEIYILLANSYLKTDVGWAQSVWNFISELNIKNTITHVLQKIKNLQLYIYNYFFENDYTCFTVYNKIKKIIDDITKNPDIEMTVIKTQIEKIKNTLQQENNKDCLDIKQKLLIKLKTDTLGKSLISFNCLTCANLIDCALECATIINQQQITD